METTIRNFTDALDETGGDQVAAAILVLAEVIRGRPLLNIDAEDLGHQFGCALKECFPTTFDVSAVDDIANALQNNAEATNDLAETAKKWLQGGY